MRSQPKMDVRIGSLWRHYSQNWIIIITGQRFAAIRDENIYDVLWDEQMGAVYESQLESRYELISDV